MKFLILIAIILCVVNCKDDSNKYTHGSITGKCLKKSSNRTKRVLFSFY